MSHLITRLYGNHTSLLLILFTTFIGQTAVVTVTATAAAPVSQIYYKSINNNNEP